MKKYSVDELKKIYDNLCLNNDNIFSREEKIVIAKSLLKKLENISCYNSLGENCLYSSLQSIEYKPYEEKEIFCDYLNMYNYSYDDSDLKYKGCPFIKIEKEVKALIKVLEEE